MTDSWSSQVWLAVWGCPSDRDSGTFLIGPESLDLDAAFNAPRIFVGNDDSKELYLAVYQVRWPNCTLRTRNVILREKPCPSTLPD